MSMLGSKHLLGKRIDQFTLDHFLGRGAMGMVFRATDTILRRTVALKLILKDADLGPMLSEAKERLISNISGQWRIWKTPKCPFKYLVGPGSSKTPVKTPVRIEKTGRNSFSTQGSQGGFPVGNDFEGRFSLGKQVIGVSRLSACLLCQ